MLAIIRRPTLVELCVYGPAHLHVFIQSCCQYTIIGGNYFDRLDRSLPALPPSPTTPHATRVESRSKNIRGTWKTNIDMIVETERSQKIKFTVV